MLKELIFREAVSHWILDSRGCPTMEVSVTLDDGEWLVSGKASVPAGASKGSHEAFDLRDGNPDRFHGLGVDKAVGAIATLSCSLSGQVFSTTEEWDMILLDIDGTPNKATLGANVSLSLSLAFARAASSAYDLPLYRYLGGMGSLTLPCPMLNVINGGAHARNNLDIQEFMILPAGAPSFEEALRWSSEVYCTLKDLLKSKHLSTGLGDEGGFAPDLENDEEALLLLTEAVRSSGFQPGRDFYLGVDAAASGWFDPNTARYVLPRSRQSLTHTDLCHYWENLAEKYPLVSIEDGMGEDDRDGWEFLMQTLGKKLLLVGDDLFVTDPERISDGAGKLANAVLIKPNQIGTLSETLCAVSSARERHCPVVFSHRSGETCDDILADLAVAASAPLIKAGAPARGERVAKYNRLLEIERESGAVFAGKKGLIL